MTPSLLKQWLEVGKCLLGAHQGDWAFEARGRCGIVQTCCVCGQVSRRVEHLWSAWAPAAASPCDRVRTCTRCPRAETQTEHAWGGWEYRRAGSCEQDRRCDRCSAWADAERVAHAWDGWSYDEGHRGPVRHCTRCRLQQSAALSGAIAATDDASPASPKPGPVFETDVREN